MKLVVCDLDGTLAQSKQPIDVEMVSLLNPLLTRLKVAIISGADWPQFQTQVIAHLATDARLENLMILPTCGAKFYRFESNWVKVYSEDFTDDERSKVLQALTEVTAKVPITRVPAWGDQIQDRGTQITFSALGQAAPLAAKAAWDPDFSKRQELKAELDTRLPNFSVNLGGTTSIDITQPGVDKAYGIYKLQSFSTIPIEQMLFLGDALFPGGNDAPARTTGVDCIQVRDPQESKSVLQALLAFTKGLEGLGSSR